MAAGGVRRWWRWLALLAAPPLLAACATPAEPTSPDLSGVTVAVYQPRTDVAAGRVAIQVRNGSANPVLVAAASLESSGYAAPFTWDSDHESRVPAGGAVDLRMPIPDSDCSAEEPFDDRVALVLRVDDVETALELVPEDENVILPRLHDEACLGERLGAVAEVSAAELTYPPGVGAVASLRLAIAPTGADGSFTIDAIRATTLLAPAVDGIAADELAIGVEVDATGPTSVDVPIVPNRCDAHALAEDKVGTRMPLLVTAPDGSTGRLVLTASDELRGQMYGYFTSTCGLG